MKQLKDIVIDVTSWKDLCLAFDAHKESVPVKMSKATEKVAEKMLLPLVTTQRLGYGYIGEGWPQMIDQTKVLEKDKLGLLRAFRIQDLHCRDVGDVIYMTNLLSPILKHIKDGVILDIGLGYGRMAIPIDFYFKKKLKRGYTYIGLDNNPVSLLLSSSILKQLVAKDTKLRTYDSTGKLKMDTKCANINILPTWELDLIRNLKNVSLFLGISTFDQLSKDCQKYYFDFITKSAKEKSYFYWYGHKKIKVPDSWFLVFNRQFPFNRDGHLYHGLWRVKNG